MWVHVSAVAVLLTLVRRVGHRRLQTTYALPAGSRSQPALY